MPRRAAPLERTRSGRGSNEPDSDRAEVATGAGTVQVRDSKDTAGPRRAFAPGPWGDFVAYAAI